MRQLDLRAAVMEAVLISTPESFLDKAREELASLRDTGGQSFTPWTADEEQCLLDFARPFLEQINAVPQKGIRIYQEFPSQVRKELLLLAGLLPAISSDATACQRSPILLVTDYERRNVLSEAAQNVCSQMQVEIELWHHFAPKLKGLLYALHKYWVVGDIDWSTFLVSPFESKRIAEAIDAIIRSLPPDPRFILVHQVDHYAVVPVA